MGNTKTTAQSDATENQKNQLEKNSPTKYSFVKRVGYVLAGIGFATSVEAATLDNKPIDLSENGKPAIGQVIDKTKQQTETLNLEIVDQNGEQKMLDELGSLADDFIKKYNSITPDNRKVVLKYYNDNHEKGKKTLKVTYQLTDLFCNIIENNKFREKFSKLIVDGKFIGDESIVDDVKSLPHNLLGSYNLLLKLDPNIKILLGYNFEGLLSVIDKTNMMLAEFIDKKQKERLAKDKQDLAKDKQDLAKDKQDLESLEKLVQALNDSNKQLKNFLNNLEALKGIVN